MKTIVSLTGRGRAVISLLLCGCCFWMSVVARGQTNSVGDIEIYGPQSVTQWDGVQIAGTVGIHSVPEYLKGGGGVLQKAYYVLKGGTLVCSNMDVQGDYYQTGGTNFVSGDVMLSGYYVVFDSSGVLCASNFYSSAAFPFDVGGTTIITNELRLAVETGYSGIYRGSGDLTVSNITLTPGTLFSFTGGTITQSGILSVENAHFFLSGPGTYNLGPLQLNSGTNSTVSFSPNQCVLRFADSSGLNWTNVAILTVGNWSGSLYGGGSQQIIFGTNSAALTSQQLSQIQFQNPAGLPPGNYPARILTTGEIVPATGAPLPPRVNLLNSSSNRVSLSVGGDIGQTYAIEVSTDLLHWLTWTSQLNTNGTISIDDGGATGLPQRFYRAHVMP